MNRRDLLKFTAAASSLTMFGNMSWANSPSTNKKLIWVILRGAQDGLSTLIPHNEPLLKEYRPTLWPQLKPNIIPLTNEFSLHPNLSFFKELFEQKQLIAIPAVSTGYNGRSHFQGQDYMECGLPQINHETGWIGRLLNVLNKKGVAISPMQPFCMRGTSLSTNWYPTKLSALLPTQYESVLDVLASDISIQNNLKRALKTRKIINDTNVNTGSKSFKELCESCAVLMDAEVEYPIATLELNGWDTHRDQHRHLNKKMMILNNGIRSIRKLMKSTWSMTTIIVTTEFGRTVKENGNGGTDHGIGSVMFVIGGNVNGGHITGNWGALSENKLIENRDIAPSTNTFDRIAETLLKQKIIKLDDVHDIFPLYRGML